MFWKRIFLVGCALLTLAACQKDPLEIALSDSNKLIAAGKFAEAESLCRQSLKSLKECSSTVELEQKQAFLENLVEIDCKYRLDYSEAVRLLKQLATIVPAEEQYQIRLRMIDIYENDLNQPTEVIFALRDLIPQAEEQERPELDSLYLRLARNLFVIHRYEQAREAVRTMLVNCPESELNFQAQVLLANCYFIQEEYHKAIAVYRTLLEQGLSREQQGEVYFELGSCYQMLSEQKEALSYYRKALEGHANPQMVQHHITYLKALVDNANLQRELKRSLLEEAWVRQAHPEQAAHYDIILK